MCDFNKACGFGCQVNRKYVRTNHALPNYVDPPCGLLFDDGSDIEANCRVGKRRNGLEIYRKGRGLDCCI